MNESPDGTAWDVQADLALYCLNMPSIFIGAFIQGKTHIKCFCYRHELYPDTTHKPCSSIREIPKMKSGHALCNTHTVFEELLASPPVEGFVLDVEH